MSVYDEREIRKLLRVTSTEDQVASAFVKVAMSLVLIPVSIALSAVAVKLGWQWFVVPLGVPAIGYVHAMGLTLIVNYMTSTRTTEKAGEKKEWSELVSEALAAPLVTLLLLWLVKMFAF